MQGQIAEAIHVYYFGYDTFSFFPAAASSFSGSQMIPTISIPFLFINKADGVKVKHSSPYPLLFFICNAQLSLKTPTTALTLLSLWNLENYTIFSQCIPCPT